MHYSWAAENPDRVACIAGIYPVCDLRSSAGSAGVSRLRKPSEQLGAHLTEHNPIDRLAP